MSETNGNRTPEELDSELLTAYLDGELSESETTGRVAGGQARQCVCADDGGDGDRGATAKWTFGLGPANPGCVGDVGFAADPVCGGLFCDT